MKPDDGSIVRLPERLDVSNAAEMVAVVQQAEASGANLIVLDFTDTLTIDSTALGAIVQIYKRLSGASRRLVLAAPGDGIRRVLAITRLDRVLPMAESVGAVVA